LQDQYRKYLNKLTTKSDQSASTVTNVKFDEKGEKDEEELLQAKSEHDGTAEQEEQTPASAKNKFENRFSEGQNTIGINLRWHLQY